MNTKTKIYISVAAAVILAFLFAGLWQSYQVTKLERSVRDARQAADEKQTQAAARELEAAEYKQKSEYLEQQLADIQTNKRKQDEKLERSITNARLARGDVERAKRSRTIPAQTVELCAKLAELGHACE